ncbi:MAG: hypothetical protein HYV63_19945 [Candidatus Schekmanbacteria bacterium]|nr:hypothetical protein [Candidatus Schekmanbacteria bacterium]
MIMSFSRTSAANLTRHRFAVAAALTALLVAAAVPSSRAAYATEDGDSSDWQQTIDELQDSTSGATSGTSSDADADTDADGVADSADFCVGDSEVDALGTQGEASILHFYMGDGPVFTIAQDLGTKLDKAMEDYDYTILLKEENNLGAIELSASAENGADEFLSPSESNFFAALRSVVRKGYLVDIWIWAHGSDSGGDGSFKAKGSWITGTDLWTNLKPSAIGCNGKLAPIRMVHSISCYHSYMGDYWTKVGAQVVSGARYINFLPNQFGGFASSWNDGNTMNQALDDANTSASRTLVHAYLEADAQLRTDGRPWYCYPVANVLGENNCAEWYIGDWWGLEDEPYSNYDTSESGQWNVNYSSSKLVYGDGSISRNDTSFEWRAPVDLSISDVDVSTDWALYRSDGQLKRRATFKVTITNNSDTYVSPSVTVRGPSTTSVTSTSATVDPIDPGHSADAYIQVVTNFLLPSSLTFTLDPSSEVNDDDRSNNTFVAELKPDYEADIYVSALDRTLGTATVSCQAHNYGYVSATASSVVAVYANGTKKSEATMSALSVNGYSSMGFSLSGLTWHTIMGLTLTCELDDTDVIAEISETNNSASENDGAVDLDQLTSNWVAEAIAAYGERLREAAEIAALVEKTMTEMCDDILILRDTTTGPVLANYFLADYLGGTSFASLVDSYSRGTITEATFVLTLQSRLTYYAALK